MSTAMNFDKIKNIEEEPRMASFQEISSFLMYIISVLSNKSFLPI